jgi:hypothetical protein
MSFVVEPGTGLEPNANSYVSLEYFVSYWSDRGFDYSTYGTPVIQRALIKATDYIEVENSQYFKGVVVDVDQPLSFPRLCCYLNRGGGVYQLQEEVPDLVKAATCEYAKRVLTGDGDLQPDPVDRDETGQQIVYSFEKIGPIETKLDYIAGSGSTVRSYPAADKLLMPLLRYSGNGGSIRN